MINKDKLNKIRIDLTNIPKDQVTQLEFKEKPGFFDINEEGFKFEDVLSVKLQISVVGDIVFGSGVLETMVICQCARCLDEFKQKIIVDDFSFEDKYHEGGSIDLTERVREDIIVRLSIKSLCRKDCKGLCCKCKKNLNEDVCSCQKDALSAVKQQKPEVGVFGKLMFDHGKIDIKE